MAILPLLFRISGGKSIDTIKKMSFPSDFDVYVIGQGKQHLNSQKRENLSHKTQKLGEVWPWN